MNRQSLLVVNEICIRKLKILHFVRSRQSLKVILLLIKECEKLLAVKDSGHPYVEKEDRPLLFQKPNDKV